MKIRTFSDYCKEVFGTKVYRLSLSTGCSCPNRDGKLGFGGCSFCSSEGSGDFAEKDKDIDVQIEEAKKRILHKFPKGIKEEERKYIAYFQSFTNTYGDTNELKKKFLRAAKREEVVALSIATRPDCLEEDKLSMLCEVMRVKPVWIELGLQTIHEATARSFNRCFDLVVFEKAYRSLKDLGFEVIVHVILGLPDETKEDILETVTFLNELNPKLDGIKLHLLHILKGTRLCKEYETKPFPIMTMDEYTDLVVDCLSILSPNIVIHRMTGDGDRSKLVAPLWSTDKKRVLNTLRKKIEAKER